jgi:hypothetical protein
MPSFELTGNGGRRWASFTIQHVNGGAGLGFSFLNFNLDMHLSAITGTGSAPANALLDMRADVRAGNGLLGTAVATPYNLPIRQRDYEQTSSITLTLQMDRSRLEAMETVRLGRDVQLALNVFAQTDDGAGPQWQTATSGHVLTQSDWGQALEQMGYRKTMLLEVPVLPAGRAPELATAAQDLAHAQQAVERGDYRDAVGHCRTVMEDIKLALKDDDSVTFAGQDGMDKATRLRLLRRAFRVFTHPAHHRDELTVTIDYNRQDAVFAVSVAAAVLAELSAPGAT